MISARRNVSLSAITKRAPPGVLRGGFLFWVGRLVLGCVPPAACSFFFILSAASAAALLLGVVGGIPILGLGLPAILSLYFDIFSGFIQAFVFCLLSMVYISSACPPPAQERDEAAA